MSISLQEYEQILPHATLDNGLIFITPNQQCAWRVETLYTKEPDTIAWLNTMAEGDILFDIGANMGQYSLLAAKRGVRVHAFEPESQNFALLCRNIAINKLGGLITPWSIALSNELGPNIFHVQQLAAGNSCNSFGHEVDFRLQPRTYPFKQGAFGTQIDQFCKFIATPPTHIKLDVDGLEHLVLEGAKKTLPHVKSVLVETNTNLEEHRQIEQMMAKNGLFPDIETAERAQRKEGTFKGVGNIVYFRNEADFLSKKDRV